VSNTTRFSCKMSLVDTACWGGHSGRKARSKRFSRGSQNSRSNSSIRRSSLWPRQFS
jgi:hypothetical protein